MRRKLAELDEQIARAQAARDAISHGLRCGHEDITQCPSFSAGVTAPTGQPLSRSHRQLHGQRLSGWRITSSSSAIATASSSGNSRRLVNRTGPGCNR